jgi:DNA-binding transcriptional ArsR family regulator
MAMIGEPQVAAGERATIDAEQQRAAAAEEHAPAAGGIQDVLMLDRVVHEPARLVILAVLNSAEEVDFAFLQTATGLTKGNLSRHASKLDEAGYIEIRKYFRGKVPATGYRLTAGGKAAFAAYWERIRAIDRRVGKAAMGD